MTLAKRYSLSALHKDLSVLRTALWEIGASPGKQGAGPFSSVELKMDLSTLEAELFKRNFTLQRLIYTGQSVKVYEITQGEYSAVVKDITYPLSMTFDRAVNEVNIILSLDHPSIVKIYDYFQYNSSAQTWQLAIVFEKVAKDLMKEIQDRCKNKYMWRPEELLGLYVQLAEAFAYLQEKGVVHRDIKPQNILIANGQIKITDFGTSKAKTPSLLQSARDWTVTGTPYFLSPQVKRGLTENKSRVVHEVVKSDVYSLGLTFLSMAKLESPASMVRIQSLPRVTAEVTDNIVYGDSIKNVLRWMLQEDERQRPDFISLLQHLRTLVPVAPRPAPIQAELSGCAHVLQGADAVIVTPCHGQLCAQCVRIVSAEGEMVRYLCSFCYRYSHQSLPQEFISVPQTPFTLSSDRSEEQKCAIQPNTLDSTECAKCHKVRSRALLLPFPTDTKLLCANCLSTFERDNRFRYGTF